MGDKVTELDTKSSADNGAAAAREKLVNDAVLRQVAGKNDLLDSIAAPDSKIAKYGLVTGKGIEKLPSGVWNAAVHSATHPLETLETLGAAAAMGVVLKTVLPETGAAGKIAAGAIGLYFTYQAARPVMDAYKEAGNAKTMADIDSAATKLGNAGGEFIVSSAIAAVGYKVGAGVTERVLLSERLDGFANAKQAFWDGMQDKIVKAGTSVTEAVGLTKTAEPVKLAESVSLDPRMQLRDGYSRYLPSEKKAPNAATLLGEVAPGAEMEATVMLKSKATDLAVDRALRRIKAGQRGFFTESEFIEKFGASEEAMAEVSKFAKTNNLKVADADMRSGRVVLKGTASDFTTAFHTQLNEYRSSTGITFRGREGALALPETLQRNIEGVYGLDDRPHARNYSVSLADYNKAQAALEAKNKTRIVTDTKSGETAILGDQNRGLPDMTKTIPDPPKAGETPPKAGEAPTKAGEAPKAAKPGGYLPNQVADAYNFPKNNMGEGSTVSIIQLGGGIDLVNEAAYYKQHGLPEPKIQVISVGNAPTKTGVNLAADGEVSLDSQIIGAIAPKAQQKVIFAPNSDKGFIDAITRATFPEKGEKPSTSISISWGAPEESWTDQGLKGMSAAFKKAALRGISIFAAAGDDGAVDKAPSGKFNADYPASDPNVTAAGGTRLEIGPDGKVKSEKVWNSSGGATGGGISQKFDVPEYQKGVDLPQNPQNPAFKGRGVPDISGNADPRTGWKIKVNGVDDVIGGTSAVAPMLAALDARISGEFGRNIGSWNPFLYKSGLSGAKFFNDIIGGHNNGYQTIKGWDATTGWGTLDGALFRDAIIADRMATPLMVRAFMKAIPAKPFDNSKSA